MKSTSRSKARVNRKTVNDLAKLIGADYKIAIETDVRRYLQKVLLQIAEALMAGEVTELCGPRYERDAQRTHSRHGYQQGVIIGSDGARVEVERPRVRTKGNQEATLQTYEMLNQRDVFDERALALISAGVSERQFGKVLEKGLKKKGVSPSTVSRSIVRSTLDSLKVFLERTWEKQRFVALLFDGVRVGRCLVVACVGIDLSGRKHILGVQPGATENEIVCRDLIRNLVDRGLNVDGNYLFVLDGSKALRRAIEERFGHDAVIQRCQEHKIRDVEAYLPRAERSRFRSRATAAFNARTYEEASKRLQELRSHLSLFSHQAVNSFTEGLDDMLTLHKLRIWGGLRDSLRTTNIIESTFSSLRKTTQNVSNWQDEPQIERWLAYGLLRTEKRFKTVPGHRTLTRLRRALNDRYAASQTR